MPDKIRLLPDTVASQIAAGEVVNRPASVVKEMMENSVDAGATAITVSYRNGGKELIKVIDDGEGMSPLDARMAFDKHATSKITRIEDVYALHTFGFRGEALASIAAIAHVELTTRRPEDELGTQLVVEGSRFQSQENVVAPVGEPVRGEKSLLQRTGPTPGSGQEYDRTASYRRRVQAGGHVSSGDVVLALRGGCSGVHAPSFGTQAANRGSCRKARRRQSAGSGNRDVAGENHRFRRKAFVQQADQPRAVHVRERPVLQEPLFS